MANLARRSLVIYNLSPEQGFWLRFGELIDDFLQSAMCASGNIYVYTVVLIIIKSVSKLYVDILCGYVNAL